jgi:hypothetical protein
MTANEIAVWVAFGNIDLTKFGRGMVHRVKCPWEELSYSQKNHAPPQSPTFDPPLLKFMKERQIMRL